MGAFWYILWVFFCTIVGGFGTFREVLWYILGGFMVHFLGFYGTMFWGFCGAIRGLYGTIQGVSSSHPGFFGTFCLVSF